MEYTITAVFFIKSRGLVLLADINKDEKLPEIGTDWLLSNPNKNEFSVHITGIEVSRHPCCCYTGRIKFAIGAKLTEIAKYTNS
jgi:hypothetical protein